MSSLDRKKNVDVAFKLATFRSSQCKSDQWSENSSFFAPEFLLKESINVFFSEFFLSIDDDTRRYVKRTNDLFLSGIANKIHCRNICNIKTFKLILRLAMAYIVLLYRARLDETCATRVQFHQHFLRSFCAGRLTNKPKT